MHLPHVNVSRVNTALEISKGVSISYTLYRTPTRQTCETVIVLYYIVYKYLLIFKKYRTLFHFISPDINTWEVGRTRE